MIPIAASASLPPLPWVVFDSPERSFALSKSEQEALLGQLRAAGVDFLSTLPTSLPRPYGDCPPNAPAVSLFQQVNSPGSGIDDAKRKALRSFLELGRSAGVLFWVKVFEFEHDEGGLWRDSYWGEDQSRLHYVDAIIEALEFDNEGRRDPIPAVLSWEECPRSSSYVRDFLAYAKRPWLRTAIHNRNGTPDDYQIQRELLDDPNLDIIELQVSNPADTHNVARWFRERTDKLIIPTEAGPGNIGIAPDYARDERMVRWWVDEPRQYTNGLGIYVGYQWPQNDLYLVDVSPWAGFLNEVTTKLASSGKVLEYLLGLRSSAGLDQNHDGAVDAADILYLRTLGR